MQTTTTKAFKDVKIGDKIRLNWYGTYYLASLIPTVEITSIKLSGLNREHEKWKITFTPETEYSNYFVCGDNFKLQVVTE
jgi:hypothetical protein